MFDETRQIDMLLKTFDHNVTYLLQLAEIRHNLDLEKIKSLEEELKKLKELN